MYVSTYLRFFSDLENEDFLLDRGTFSGSCSGKFFVNVWSPPPLLKCGSFIFNVAHLFFGPYEFIYFYTKLTVVFIDLLC